MKRIRIKFIDYYGRRPEEIYYYRILKRFYDVELCDDPDFVIDGGLGREYVDYDCVKLVTIGENYAPDFNFFDYAIGFDPIEFGDRYLRFPLYATYPEFEALFRPRDLPAELLLKREFCSFVVSNGGGDPLRTEFFNRLSKYRKVLSGGRYLNNVGGPVPDKEAFCAGCKFNIAFENSVVPGYATEKIVQAYAANTVPIYHGDPLVGNDFTSASMVRVTSRDDVERAVEEIIALDRDDDAYLAKVRANPMVHPHSWYEDRVTRFLRNVFDQTPEAARRLAATGHQTVVRRQLRKLWRNYDHTHPVQMIKKLRKRFGRK